MSKYKYLFSQKYFDQFRELIDEDFDDDPAFEQLYCVKSSEPRDILHLEQ